MAYRQIAIKRNLIHGNVSLVCLDLTNALRQTKHFTVEATADIQHIRVTLLKHQQLLHVI